MTRILHVVRDSNQEGLYTADSIDWGDWIRPLYIDRYDLIDLEIPSEETSILEVFSVAEGRLKEGAILSLRFPTSKSPIYQMREARAWQEMARILGWIQVSFLEGLLSSPVLILRPPKRRKSKVFLTAAEEYEESLVSLFIKVFGHPISKEFWRWKYSCNRKNFSVAAFLSGRLVGHYGGMERDFINGNRTFLVVQSCDVAIDNSYRTQYAGGLFEEISSRFISYAYAQGVEILFGFPHRRHMLLGKRLGLYRSCSQLLQWRSKAREREGNAVLKQVDLRSVGFGFIAQFVDVFEESSSRLSIGYFNRDKAYIRKRYIDHPEHQYLFFTDSGNRFLLVGRLEGKSMRLMDYLGDIMDFSEAVNELGALCNLLSVPNIVFWSSEYMRRLLDLDCHFSLVDSSASVAFRMRDDKDASANLWLSCGDTDFL